MTRPGPTLCLAVHQGFSVRYLLQTDILPRLLAQEARVAVITEAAEADRLRAALPAAVAVAAAPDVPAPGPLVRWLAQVRWSLHGGHVATAHEVFRRHLGDAGTWRNRAAVRVFHGLGRTIAALGRPARRLVARLEGRLSPGRGFDALLRERRPDLVVVTSTGAFGFDAPLARAARRAGIPVTVVVLSWDNVTSKAYPAFAADHAVAWTEAMKESLIRHNDFRSRQVTVCGVAHFDVYRRPDPAFDRAAVLRGLGLDPARRTVILATKSPNSYLWNPNLAELLAAAMADRRLPDCQLAIRVHPIHYRRDRGGGLVYGAVLEAYRDLAARFGHVRLSEPLVVEGSPAFAMAADEMLSVARLMRAADVLVNFFSTMNIEGALLDRPLVNVCFEGETLAYAARRKARNDIGSDFVEDHNQRIVDAGAATTAFTPEQLVEQVARYLADPGHDRADRALVARREGGPNQGRAVVAIADRLLHQAMVARAAAARKG